VPGMTVGRAGATKATAVRHAWLLLPAAVSLTASLLFLLGADFVLTQGAANVAALAALFCGLWAAFAYRAWATAALALVLVSSAGQFIPWSRRSSIVDSKHTSTTTWLQAHSRSKPARRTALENTESVAAFENDYRRTFESWQTRSSQATTRSISTCNGERGASSSTLRRTWAGPALDPSSPCARTCAS
jgi:hypothetical protein